MSIPNQVPVFIPNDGAVPPLAVIGSGPVVDMSQCDNKGYDYVRDPGAAFAGNLEGSVAMRQWSVIAALGASGQGAVDDWYNYVRVTVTGGGAIGPTTQVVAGGRVP